MSDHERLIAVTRKWDDEYKNLLATARALLARAQTAERHVDALTAENACYKTALNALRELSSSSVEERGDVEPSVWAFEIDEIVEVAAKFTHQLVVRVSDAVYEALQEDAEHYGRTVTQSARHAITRHLGVTAERDARAAAVSVLKGPQ